MDMNWKSLAAMLPVQPCDELKRDVLMGIYDMHDLGGDLILYHRESVGLADEIGQIMDPQDWARWEQSKKRRWGARCTCTACDTVQEESAYNIIRITQKIVINTHASNRGCYFYGNRNPEFKSRVH